MFCDHDHIDLLFLSGPTCGFHFVLQLFHLKEVKHKQKIRITSNSNLFSLLVLSVVKGKRRAFCHRFAVELSLVFVDDFGLDLRF